jgi:hypothetical protein
MKLKIMAVLSIMLIISTGVYASKGTTVAPFLKLGFGARASGLGEAYSSLATDATGEYWNIGAVAFADKSQVAYMHNNIYQDVSHNYISYIHKLSESSFITAGLSYISLGNLDKIRITNFYTPEIIGQYEYTNSVISVGYSKKFDVFRNTPFSLGLNLKSIRSSIDVYSASAVALDIGSFYELNETINMAVLVKNLGTKMKYVQEKEDLPLTYVLGCSVNLEKRIILSLDFNFSPYEQDTFNFGTEYILADFISLRAGYNSVNDLEDGITNFGIGMKLLNFDFDYAYMLYGALGNSHKFSLNYEL